MFIVINDYSITEFSLILMMFLIILILKVTGMLVYYILSGSKHPFGKGPRCEANILDGNYSLHDVQDVLAKDLIEWMINEDPTKRPTVEQCLAHPFFWSNER